MLQTCIKLFTTCYIFLMKYCAKEYLFTLESYYYYAKKQTYVLVFRVRNKQIIQKLYIQKVFLDKDFLSLIHPVDAYIIGIIYGMYKNNVTIHTNVLNSFKGYKSYHIIEPQLFVTIPYLTNNSNIVILKLKHGTKLFEISTLELCEKPFLLHAIGAESALSLGFFVSEQFISEIT